MKLRTFILAAAMASIFAVANAQIDHTSHNADGSKYGFVDKNNQWILKPEYDNASWDASMQIGIVGNFKQPKGAVNAKGEYILPVKYSKIRTNPQSGTLFVAEERDGETYWGIFTKEGKPLIPLQFKAVLFNRANNQFECTTTSDSKVLYNEDGSEVK